jgi:arginine/lysine/ornithine decarboxylase
MMACSCSLLPTREIQVSAKPIDRQIVQPVMPREIDLKQVRWLTITPENFEEQFALIENQEGELVFLAMTVPDYETMAYNMQEIKRYITELKDVVVYYRKVTVTQKEE